jgi:hypothetical protein
VNARNVAAESADCDPLRRDIGRRLLACGPDELRVLDALLERIELGRDRYGFLDLARARDWDREQAEELLDVQVYRAVGRVLEKSRACVPPGARGGILLDFEMSDLGGED